MRIVIPFVPNDIRHSYQTRIIGISLYIVIFIWEHIIVLHSSWENIKQIICFGLLNSLVKINATVLRWIQEPTLNYLCLWRDNFFLLFPSINWIVSLDFDRTNHTTIIQRQERRKSHTYFPHTISLQMELVSIQKLQSRLQKLIVRAQAGLGNFQHLGAFL